MDRLRLEPGTLGEALGGTAGGGAERDCGSLCEKDLEDGVDQSRLTDARTASDRQHLGNESNANSLSLAIGEHQLRPLLDPRDSLVGIDRRPRRPSDSERLELFGDLPLGPVEAGEEDAAMALEVIGDYGAAFELEAERRFDELSRDFEQRLSERDELFGREPAMPFVHRLGQRVGDAGTHADQRRLLDAELARDLIRCTEADAADVAGQSVRVLRDELDSITAVGFVDAHGTRGTDAVAVQEQHDLANDLLLGPAADDALRPLGADPCHLPQTARLLLDDVKNGIPECAHQLLRVDRPDAADHPGAEILFDPFDRRRRRGLEERGSELDAMRAVVDPGSARLHKLAGRDHRCVTKDGDQVALTAGFDAQHAEAVLFVVEGDALDEAG